MPSFARIAPLPVSFTFTANPFACRCFTQSWQQPQFGSFQTSTSVAPAFCASAARGSVASADSRPRRMREASFIAPPSA
jgi:hypothetical protein